MSDLPPTPGPLPGPRSRAELERLGELLYPGTANHLMPFVVAAKSGHLVEDLDGNLFVDLISASASVPLGAARGELIEPLVETLRRVGNEDSHGIASDLMRPLAERLLAITPDSLTRVDLSLNGTESVETAVKMMRRATGRPIVIGFLGGYHGETAATAALGAEETEIARGIRALTPGYVHVPYPNPYRSPFAAPRPGGSGDATVDYLRDHLLFHAVDPDEVAGVLIEPILGSGGCVAPPPGFWPALVELCREHDWLLAVDEVKTGFGRSGAMFAVERCGVEPDLMCLGKAMGGGVAPIGAVLGSERTMGGYDDVPTGSTWSWLPWACAAALATLDVYEREPVLENVRELERVGGERLATLAARFPQVGETRAVGGFQAIEFVRDRESRERDPELQHLAARRAVEFGVLMDSSSTSLNIQPSLLMPPAELLAALDRVEEAVAAAVAELGR
ncbi:MAG TPA: aminotransferase class III-fold pyridoxal phosphate-dependent enzyme [Solirubrobacterales bacterium]|nr:aminotransferase class III-fold pyridoxal phosphate-dependent enzyme [Solirubrobacterales bacterium]